MRNTILTVATLALFGCASATETPAPDAATVDAARGQAQAAAGRLAKTLGGKLMAALDTGGPEGALGVCADVAQQVTRETAETEGFHISRTALRLRNPANAPDHFERGVMLEWALGDAEPKVHEQVLPTEDGGHELRWMKPLMANALCLTCHGDLDDLPAAARATLAERYPLDEAAGFASGELRGAITVRIPLR